MTSELSSKMAEAAVKRASQLGIKINVAILDDGGQLVHFHRMDQAPILSIEIAQNKAYTAVAFGLPTHEWYPLIQKEPPLREGIVHTPRLVIFGGGFPIKIEGDVIGGIGVSGGSTEEDIACCLAALSLIE
ncbi:heme-binding protein [Ammoniphilus sp. YIM 78166]|uniref:GlcG/HbpS family heme-binding protein n=1 Tax=Ammoniphilus sp. YIM 78166 TaxID=1644106 RepID=UPI0035187D91